MKPKRRVRNDKTGEEFESLTAAAYATGVNSGVISDCCRNRYQKTKDQWSYVDEKKESGE